MCTVKSGLVTWMASYIIEIIQQFLYWHKNCKLDQFLHNPTWNKNKNYVFVNRNLNLHAKCPLHCCTNINASVILGSFRFGAKAEISLHMGQKLQDGKKVLEMSQLHPHSKSHPVQTIPPTDLGLYPVGNLWLAHLHKNFPIPETPGNLCRI